MPEAERDTLPFVLSLSKHRPHVDGSEEERPFDKLRANGESCLL